MRGSAERKTVDLTSATYACDTTGTVTLLNGVAIGDDFTDRDGRRTTMKSLFIRGTVYPIDETTEPTLARIIVVYDRQSNGAAPVFADLLTVTTSVAHLNLNNRSRFQIIADEQFFIGKVTTTATQTYAGSPTGHSVNIFRKLNLETQFSGTGATVASIATGSIYMFTVGNQAVNAGCIFQVATRIRFTDAR